MLQRNEYYRELEYSSADEKMLNHGKQENRRLLGPMSVELCVFLRFFCFTFFLVKFGRTRVLAI